MRLVNGLTNLALMTALAGSIAHADLGECQRAKREGKAKCDHAFEILSGGKLDDAGSVDENTGYNDGSASLVQKVGQNIDVWERVPPFCRKLKNACAEACNQVSGEEREEARTIKTDCFAAIEDKISEANRNVASLTSSSDAIAGVGNGGGSSDAQKIEGAGDEDAKVQKVVCPKKICVGLYAQNPYTCDCETAPGNPSSINGNIAPPWKKPAGWTD